MIKGPQGCGPRFELCPCGEHGPIVLANGERHHVDNCSKQQAFLSIDHLLYNHRITQVEAESLNAQAREITFVEDSAFSVDSNDKRCEFARMLAS